MVAETFLAMGPNEVGMYALAATRTWLYVFGIALAAATWQEPPLPNGEGTHAPDAMTSAPIQAIGNGLLGGDAQRHYLSFLRAEGLQLLKQLVRAETGETNERRLTLRVVQAIGGLIYPLLVGSFIEPAAGVSFAEDGVRREHVAICLQNLLGRAAEPRPAAGTASRRPAAASAAQTKRRKP